MDNEFGDLLVLSVRQDVRTANQSDRLLRCSEEHFFYLQHPSCDLTRDFLERRTIGAQNLVQRVLLTFGLQNELIVYLAN